MNDRKSFTELAKDVRDENLENYIKLAAWIPVFCDVICQAEIATQDQLIGAFEVVQKELRKKWGLDAPQSD